MLPFAGLSSRWLVMAEQRSSAVLAVLALVVFAVVGWFLLGAPESGQADGPAVVAGQAPADPAASLEAASLTTGAAGAAAAEPRQARTELPVATDPGKVHVTGRLVTVAREAVPDVEVGMTLAGGSEAGLPIELADVEFAGRTDRKPAASARTDRDGRFTLALEKGSGGRLAIASDAWYVRGSGEGRAAGDEAMLRVSPLTSDRDLGDIVLGRTGAVSGVVHDEVGKPVAGVRVSVATGGLGLGLGRSGGEVTGVDGRFERSGLRPGKYTIATASPDHVPTKTKIEVGDGERRDGVVLTLHSGRTIAGVVVDDRGTPLAGMRVGADRARELAPGVQVQTTNQAEATTTDASGRFVLRGLEGATVNVEAWGKGHARGRVAGVAVGTSDLVVEMARNGQVRGRVVDAAGEGVAGSRVVARPAGEQAGPWIDEAGVTTDAAGEFVLDSVRPGAVRVVATGDHLRAESDPIDVRPGGRVEGVRVVAARGATVAVTVRDGAGKPIAGAKVKVTAPAAAPAGRGQRAMSVRRRVDADGTGDVMIGDPAVLGSATTDADGVARVAGLRAGPVVVDASDAKHAPAKSPPLTVPDAGEVETQLTLLAGGFVQLHVLDAANAPLPGASYKLTGPAGAGDEPPTERGTCDASGLALIGPLPAGSWTARLSLPPRPVELGDGMSFLALGNGGHDLPQTEVKVEVVAEKTVPVTLVRPQLARLRGTIHDTKGAVANAKVEMSAADDVIGLGSPYKATSDASGAFELADLPPGQYVLRYGYADAVAMSEQPLQIATGEVLVERELMLRTGTVKLIVRGEDGEAIAGARVTLVAGGGSSSAPRREIRMVAVVRGDGGDDSSTTSISAGAPSATSDAIGEVEIGRVPEGKYTVRVEHPRHVTTTKPDVQVQDGATTDLGSLAMAPGGELRGRVTAEDGSAVRFSSIEVTPLPSGEVRNEPAMNGSFRIGGLAAGRYRVRATQPSLEGAAPAASDSVEVELGKGERKLLDLRLQ